MWLLQTRLLLVFILFYYLFFIIVTVFSENMPVSGLGEHMTVEQQSHRIVLWPAAIWRPCQFPSATLWLFFSSGISLIFSGRIKIKLSGQLIQCMIIRHCGSPGVYDTKLVTANFSLWYQGWTKKSCFACKDTFFAAPLTFFGSNHAVSSVR